MEPPNDPVADNTCVVELIGAGLPGVVGGDIVIPRLGTPDRLYLRPVGARNALDSASQKASQESLSRRLKAAKPSRSRALGPRITGLSGLDRLGVHQCQSGVSTT
jgi:hypothetical protein